jgi:hypothetical protein
MVDLLYAQLQVMLEWIAAGTAGFLLGWAAQDLHSFDSGTRGFGFGWS